MFGFSFAKLLVLFAIIIGVMVAYRYFGSRRMVDDDRDRRKGGARRSSPDVEDMERCTVCGDFVSAGSGRNCGRENCPF